MRLIVDNTTQAAALVTLRELIAAGLAGNDHYDHQIFVVDAPQEQRDLADVALDQLGASFHKNGAYGAPRSALQCQLPRWVRAELGLDNLGAPTIIMPLASRAVGYLELDPGAAVGSLAAASLDLMIDEVERRHA